MVMVSGPCQECHTTHWAASSHFIYIVGHIVFGDWQRVTQYLCLPYMVGSSLIFQVVFYPVTWLALIQLQVLNPSGGRVSGWWIYSYLVGRVLHCSITHLPLFCEKGVNFDPLPTWTTLWGLLLFEPGCQSHWAWPWFYHHGLFWNVRTADILSWGCFHDFFSLFWVFMLDNSILQVASSIKCHTSWCQARA